MGLVRLKDLRPHPSLSHSFRLFFLFLSDLDPDGCPLLQMGLRWLINGGERVYPSPFLTPPLSLTLIRK